MDVDRQSQFGSRRNLSQTLKMVRLNQQDVGIGAEGLASTLFRCEGRSRSMGGSRWGRQTAWSQQHQTDCRWKTLSFSQTETMNFFWRYLQPWRHSRQLHHGKQNCQGCTVRHQRTTWRRPNSAHRPSFHSPESCHHVIPMCGHPVRLLALSLTFPAVIVAALLPHEVTKRSLVCG